MFRNLARRKLRTALTILGITVGIWALMVMSAMANKLTAIVDGGSTYFDNKVVVSDATNPAFAFGLTPIPIGVVDQVAQIPGVAVAAPRVQFLLDSDDSGTGFNPPDFVVAFTAGFDQGYETFRPGIAQGRETTLADEGRHVVVLGADLARKFNIHPSDSFDIRGFAFETIGVLEPSLTFFDTTAVIPWAAGQELLESTHLLPEGLEEGALELTSMVIVYPEAGADKASLIQAIETSFPQLRAVSGDDFDEQFGSTIAIFNAIILRAYPNNPAALRAIRAQLKWKGDVVAWRLVPADQNASKAVHPAVSAFHHPAPGFETGFIFDGPSFFAPAANVGREANSCKVLRTSSKS